MRLRGGTAAVAAMTVFAVAGRREGTTGSPGPQDTTGRGGPALDAAKSLTVKGRAPGAVCAREAFRQLNKGVSSCAY
jgi:hypothetical protein